MCVWDFNNACNNYFEEELPYTGFFLNNRLWFEMLIKDEDFTERIIQRYHSLRKGLLSEESLYRYIDETLDFIGPALERNDARWGSVEQQAKGLLVPVSRNLDSRSAAEGQLKGYLRNDLLSYALLTIIHDVVNQACDQFGIIHRIRQNIAFCYIASSWHSLPSFT